MAPISGRSIKPNAGKAASVAKYCELRLLVDEEALNTAIEFLTDVASPDFHPLAEKAKDVAAGAVLLAAIGAVIIGGLIFWPKAVRWSA